MITNIASMRCCDAYLRSAASTVRRLPADLSVLGRETAVPLRRVLVVEFRDEVFAGLKSLLEDCGCEVARAASAAAVAAQLNQFAPDLLLVNEDMPDESGWLIICKLRLNAYLQPAWLYAVQAPRIRADWKEACGVDQVISYGGVLSRLVLRVRERIECWQDRSGAKRGSTSHPGLQAAVA